MKMSSFRVRTRLIAGFALLLLMTAFIGVLGVSELSKLNHTVEQLATSDWETARTAISLRSNIRSIAARTAEFLLADAAARPGVRSKMEENRAAIQESLQKMSTLADTQIRYEAEAKLLQAAYERLRTAMRSHG